MVQALFLREHCPSLVRAPAVRGTAAEATRPVCSDAPAVTVLLAHSSAGTVLCLNEICLMAEEVGCAVCPCWIPEQRYVLLWWKLSISR